MNDFAAALRTAVDLILGFDAGLRAIVLLSLQVSLTASACAFAIGAPLGTALAVYRFRGRGAVVVVVALGHELVLAGPVMHQQSVGIAALSDRKCLAGSYRNDVNVDSVCS